MVSWRKMSCASGNHFYIPSKPFVVEVSYYLDDIKEMIPQPLPSSSSARLFHVMAEIWAKYKKKTK